jgi:MFS transporter, DHA2 family, multidrug resistance protein
MPGRTAGLTLLVTGSVVFSVALAPVDTLATDMAVAAVPQERAGATTAVTESSAEIGGALGIALLGVAGTAVYRSRVAGAVPAGVPAHTEQAARDTLGGAVAAAGQLPGPVGAPLVSAARQSFAPACTWCSRSAPSSRWPPRWRR